MQASYDVTSARLAYLLGQEQRLRETRRGLRAASTIDLAHVKANDQALTKIEEALRVEVYQSIEDQGCRLSALLSLELRAIEQPEGFRIVCQAQIAADAEV